MENYYYKKLYKKDYEYFTEALKGYESAKENPNAIVGNDEHGEFVLVPTPVVGEFVVTCLSREDFRSEGFNPDNLSDEDMQTIADEMGDHFVEYGSYWEDIDDWAVQYGCEKTEDQDDPED